MRSQLRPRRKVRRLLAVIAALGLAALAYANVQGVVSPGGQPTIDTTNSLSTGLIRYAIDTGGGTYWDAVNQTPLLNPVSVGGGNTTYPTVQTQWGRFINWQGAAYDLGQYGWWFDVDIGGNTNAIQAASQLTGQPAGAGMTLVAGFVVTAKNTATGPEFIFGRYLNPDGETQAAGFFIQSNSYNVNAYYANESPPNQQNTVLSTQIGNTYTVTPNTFHVAALVMQNTSSAAASTTGTFYIDGVQQGSPVTGINAVSPCADCTWSGGVLNAFESQLQIGGGYHTGDLVASWDYMDGYVPMAAVYNVPLTAAQVASISANPYQVLIPNGGPPPPPPPSGASLSLIVTVTPPAPVCPTITAPTTATLTVGTAVWSFGTPENTTYGYPLLNNGVQFQGGFGVILKNVSGVVWTQSLNGSWYTANAGGWAKINNGPGC